MAGRQGFAEMFSAFVGSHGFPSTRSDPCSYRTARFFFPFGPLLLFSDFFCGGRDSFGGPLFATKWQVDCCQNGRIYRPMFVDVRRCMCAEVAERIVIGM